MATRWQTNAWYAAPSIIDHGERQPEFTNYCKDRSPHKTTFIANMLTFPPYFPSLDVFIYLFQLGNAPQVPQIAKARALSVPLFTSSPLVVATYPPKLHISRDVNTPTLTFTPYLCFIQELMKLWAAKPGSSWYSHSLVPRPSHRPVFDHLQYAKMHTATNRKLDGQKTRTVQPPRPGNEASTNKLVVQSSHSSVA